MSLMEMVATAAAMRCAKLQSNHHKQQTNTQLFTGRMPVKSNYNSNYNSQLQCQGSEGKNMTSVYKKYTWLATATCKHDGHLLY